MFKQFIESKGGQRALWTVLNSLMALGLSILAFLATDNVMWAVTILPFAQAMSQWFTKTIVNPKIK